MEELDYLEALLYYLAECLLTPPELRETFDSLPNILSQE